MKTVPLNFVGGENESRSRFWSSQSSVNLYIDTHVSGRSPAALLPWPGEKPFSSGVAGTTRGMELHNDKVYLIVDTALIEIDQNGNRTTISGTILGTDRCSMVSDGTNLIIRNGSSTQIYNTSLSTVTDTDLENAQTVTYINNQVIYQGTGARFCSADAGDPTSIDGLNYATAESYPDDIKQVYAFNERLYIAGESSFEVWYNSGTGSPPFDRIQQSTVRRGVKSSFSIASSESYLYFLSDDDQVYRMTSYQPENITPSAIAKELREDATENSQGYVCNLDGQNFYILQTGQLTLAFSERTGEWVRLSTGTSLGRHLINGYVYAFGKHLVCDYDSGDVYEWDFNTYTSNGATIIRQRDSAPVNGLQLGIPGSRILMSRAEAIMETGVGNTDVPDPEIMFSCSIDGGRSFTGEDWVKIGREGESVKRVEWYNMQSFYDVVIRIRVSDPCFVGFHGAAIDLKGAGW